MATKKKKTNKKTKKQKAEERKVREKERAKRDRDNAKRRLSLKTKEQRKKILEFRRLQSRFQLPTIDDINNKNYEFKDDQTQTQTQQNDNINDQEVTPPQTPENKSNDNDNNNNISNGNSDMKYDTNDNDNSDNDSVHSVIYLEELTISDMQEELITHLENAFIDYDEEYYGFIGYDKFLGILRDQKIRLSQSDETYLLIALTLIDDGVDYFGFLQTLRTNAAKSPKLNLAQLCKKMAQMAELTTKDESNNKNNEEVKVDEDELDKFYKAAKNAKARGMNLAEMSRTSAVIPSTNKIRKIVEEFTLDGSDVDFALLKTALSFINCRPNDDDLKFLLNYLFIKQHAETHDDDGGNAELFEHPVSMEEDDHVFVDFNYLIAFCQEVTSVPVIHWRNPQKIIEKVAKQTRVIHRAQVRRKDANLKAKKRLEKRNKNQNAKKNNKKMSEIRKIEMEEKRLRALKLRDKAKRVSIAPNGSRRVNNETMILKEWISKRNKNNSKKSNNEFKKWMQKNNVFNKLLMNELNRNDIRSIDSLKCVNQVKLDQLLRKVRAEKFAETKDRNSRNKMDKLLVSFEKKYKKLKKSKKK